MIVEARPNGGEDLLVFVCDEGSGPLPRVDGPGLGLGLGLMAQLSNGFWDREPPAAGYHRLAALFPSRARWRSSWELNDPVASS